MYHRGTVKAATRMNWMRRLFWMNGSGKQPMCGPPTCRNNLAYVGHLSASLAHATAEANRQSPSNFAKTGSNKSNRPLGLIDAAVMANAPTSIR
jgi:hypothetical protein